MGGSDPFFEESKSGDTMDMIVRMHGMFITHPVYTCAAIGAFLLASFIYVFLQR